MNFVSRRDFLKIMTEALLALSGLLGLGGLLRFLGYAGESKPPQVYDLGLAESYLPVRARWLPTGSSYLYTSRLALLPSIPAVPIWAAG